MPAPSGVEYSAAALVAAHTALLAEIDGGSAAGYVAVRSSSDVLLGVITLADPAGTVNGTTGQITLSFPAAENAVASGTAAYGEICDSDDTVIVAMPASAGASPVSGELVLNSLTIASGTPIEVLSATIG